MVLEWSVCALERVIFVWDESVIDLVVIFAYPHFEFNDIPWALELGPTTSMCEL
jgi:hypothetical protein